MKTMSACLLGMLVLAGCAGSNVKDQGQASSNAAQAKGAAADPFSDPSSLLSKRSVYFDYNRFNVKAADKPVLDAHGRYLNEHAGANLVLEGNADERGSREYNLALGNRRAESAKKALLILGARDKQVEVVSFGKEKPKATCHEESCWAENRRADLNYRSTQ